MSFLSSLSTGQLMLLAWLVLQLVSWLTKKNVPAGPPGGNVIAIHTKEEYEEAQRKAKESGALVRTATPRDSAACDAVVRGSAMSCVLRRCQQLADVAPRVAPRAAVRGLQRHVVRAMPSDRPQVRNPFREGPARRGYCAPLALRR